MMSEAEKFLPRPDRITSTFFLTKLIDDIMNKWEAYVRQEVPSAAKMLRSALRNTLPKFLNLLSGALSEDVSRGMLAEGSDLIRHHASERARETSFDPKEIVQELLALRNIVTKSLEEAMELSAQDYTTIQKTFDQAIQESLMEFFLAHSKMREQFTATLSHDLRNPLAAAKLAAELIEMKAGKIEDIEAQAPIQDLTTRIISSIKRADQMIQDLLDASILQLGKRIPLQISKCDLLNIVNEVVGVLEELAQARIKIVGANILGYWDKEGLRRAIENLIKNAIKYGDPETEITITIERKNDSVQIRVHNFGNPISPKNQNFIFRRFGRTKSAQKGGTQGWGLGLEMVRSISQALGGSTEVKSSEELGTTFTINLPRDSNDFVNASEKPQ